MTRRPSRALALSALVVSGALVLAACGDDGDDKNTPAASTSAPAAPGSAAPSAPQAAAFNDSDVMFAQMMIPHHEQAVEMADAVLAKTTDARVRQLATAIKAAQSPEIAQMKGWLTAWGKPTAAPGGMAHGSGMMSDADMQKFKAASGAELDRQFLQMMIVHHNGAIAMADDELAKGVNPDARKLAEAVKTSQSAEVAQMQQMLNSSGGTMPSPSASSSGMGGMPGMGH
ncbi:MAG: DUF305 domain-containing protein [Streptomycetaceae bacterium]|nr:DUF305 domain-containing protein [Streptomycetaceae bacterium]